MGLAPCKECCKQVSAVIGQFSRDTSSTPSGGNSTNPAAKSDSSAPTVTLPRTALADLKLTFTWRKEGFDNVMMANFTIRNNGPAAVKDVEITCTHSATSGTVIGSSTRTIYEVVKAHATKRVVDFNMGFIHSQGKRSGCVISDFKIAE